MIKLNINRQKLKVIAKWIGWISLGVSFLLIFTLAKLPEAKIKNLIQGHLSALLSAYEITFVPRDSSLSFLLGLKYKMKDVRIYLPPPAKEVTIDKIVLTPSIFQVLLGTYKVNLNAVMQKSSVDLDFSIKKNFFKILFELDNLDLGKLEVFPLFTQLKGSAQAAGYGKFSSELNRLSSLDTDVLLNFKNIMIEQQSIAGFNIPELTISEGLAELSGKSGKVEIKKLRLGKEGSNKEDLVLNLNGEVNFKGKSFNSGELNLKIRFKPSDKILKTFVLLDTFLKNGKQADGSYAIQLTGPVDNVKFSPTGS